MKIAVIGGAGVRTPLLVSGLTHSDLPIEEIALYDVDRERLPIIGRLAAQMAAGGARIATSDSVAECVIGADFVFTSIRVGGLDQRIRDEAISQRHGVAGQETVGPAGFAMAARTIPHMIRYAREISRAAPRAWIINFTNPVGMVTEAMRTETERVIGICDTPTELFGAVAQALELDPSECAFDYFGLNHLGWLREVYSGGVAQLRRLWNRPDRLQAVYRVPLFEASALRTLELLPTEYVYYYDQPGRALDNVRRAGQTRGQAIAELTRVLFESLRAPRADTVAIYTSYLWTRSAGYMQIEAGSDVPATPATASGLSGYDRIALGVVRAIHLNTNTIIPLSVANRGNIADLLDRDVVEVPCVVNANGARPLHVGRVPDRIAPLLTAVKEYERLTVRAALAQSVPAAGAALAANPLVADRATAESADPRLLAVVVTLNRGMGLLQATATNIIGMVGVGPFLTIPFMVSAMGGPHILYAWIFGAMLALCDGLVYAELGAALPGSGGPYVYLREAYRPFGLGGLAAFIFIFQVMLVAPLSIAGGAVGFADYLGFYWTTMEPLQHNVIAAAVCVTVTALLYRDITSVGRLAVLMLVVVLGTVGWVIVAGLLNTSWSQAFDFPPAARRIDGSLVRAIGAAGLLAMYNYGGYNNVCNIGDELRDPERTMPRAIVLSIATVVVLYIVMSTVVLGLVPWQEAQQSRMIASLFIERTHSNPASGRTAAIVMTALILFVTASSLYAVVLGYSRIPYAAAKDGQFFAIFGRLHPTKRFPHVSLLTIGAVTIPFCFFTLGQLVNWLILVQILSQFVWQCAGVMLLRRYRRDIAKPFRMWLYPAPAVVSLAMWLYVFATAPLAGILFSAAFLAAAIGAYAIFQRPAAA